MTQKNFILYSIIIFFISFLVNYQSASIGILPIDSFAFFDTGYLVSKGLHPLKDFWVTTGILVDYFQAIFFKLFGVSWFSYTLHASAFNFLLAMVFFIFLAKNKVNIKLSFFYSISISILFYPSIGTPFAYHHSLMFSFLTLMCLIMIIESNHKYYWIYLPVLMLVSFLCMQTPSAYVNLIVLIYLLYHCFKYKEFKQYKFFLFGCLFCVLLLFSYFMITQVPIKNFITQYLLFPLSIGSDRIISSDGASVALNSKFNFKYIIKDFKFIHIIILTFIIASIYNLKFKKKKRQIQSLEMLVVVIFFSIFIIFNQLVTVNQIYIFSIIPLLAGLTSIVLEKKNNVNKYFNAILIAITLISTLKYYERFVLDRKFIDLENINLKNYFKANELNSQFNELKWISVHYSKKPNEELKNLKMVMKKIENDKDKKMVISHYQFFSAISNTNLNNLNRWYTIDNNSFPLENNKYFKVYADFIKSKIKKNKIKVIYIIDDTGGNYLNIDVFKKYLNDICFSDETIIKGYFSSHTLKNCK